MEIALLIIALQQGFLQYLGKAFEISYAHQVWLKLPLFLLKCHILHHFVAFIFHTCQVLLEESHHHHDLKVLQVKLDRVLFSVEVDEIGSLRVSDLRFLTVDFEEKAVDVMLADH